MARSHGRGLGVVIWYDISNFILVRYTDGNMGIGVGVGVGGGRLALAGRDG